MIESLHDGDEKEASLMRGLLDGLEFGAGERELALRAAFDAAALAERMVRSPRRSELYATLAGRDPEEVALAGALVVMPEGRTAAEQARLWFEDLRRVRLEITGDDLLDAGVAPGPEIGERLQAALASKLDGQLVGSGAGAELKAALEVGE